jgi:hypothetical protein
MRKASFPLILAIFLAAAGHLHAAKEGGEKPRIYLEKRVIAEKTGEQIKFFELYRMKRDDTLWEIFIDKLGGRKEEFISSGAGRKSSLYFSMLSRKRTPRYRTLLASKRELG